MKISVLNVMKGNLHEMNIWMINDLMSVTMKKYKLNLCFNQSANVLIYGKICL